jgi:hypothetical protein
MIFWNTPQPWWWGGIPNLTVPKKQLRLLGREPLKFTNQRRLPANCGEVQPHMLGLQIFPGFVGDKLMLSTSAMNRIVGIF